jgi:hypothetical protein
MASSIINAIIEKYSDGDGNINIPQSDLVDALKSMKGSKTPKRARDPDAPKRPAPSYMRWLNESRSDILSEHFPENEDGDNCFPDGHEKAGEPLVGREKVTAVAKTAGKLWKALDASEKKPFVDAFESELAEYNEAKGDYSPKKQKVLYDSEEMPSAPEDWSGPFKMTYISKIAKDPETGKNLKSFKTFDEAIAKANELAEGCAGVTKTSTGYSLRIGPELKKNPAKDSKSGIASWMKGECDGVAVTADTSDSESNDEMASKPSSPEPDAESDVESDAEVVESDAEVVESDAEVEVVKVKVQAKKAKPVVADSESGSDTEAEVVNVQPKKKAKKAKKAEPVMVAEAADSDTEAEVKVQPKKTKAKKVDVAKPKKAKKVEISEPKPKKAKKAKKAEPKKAKTPEPESDEETEVSEISINGIAYFLDDDGNIFDQKTQDEVGKSKNGVHTLFK